MLPEFFSEQDEWLDQVGRIYVLLNSVVFSQDTARPVGLRNANRLHANRLRAIHSSTAIEGNRLTLDQVTAVIQGHPVFGPPKDVREVQNAWSAYESLDTYDPYSVNDFLRAHGLLTQGLITESGQFRTVDVEIVDGVGQVLHTGSRASKVPRLIHELLEWASTTRAHPLVASSATHYLIEHIHPFRDGNGRIGRLWQTLMLSRWNPIFTHLPTETLIARHQSGYYAALQASHDPEIDAAPFIGFMLGIIEESLAEYQAGAANEDTVVDNVVDNVVETHRRVILAAIAANPSITQRELARLAGITTRTVSREIKKLREADVLRRMGSDRLGHWVITDGVDR